MRKKMISLLMTVAMGNVMISGAGNRAFYHNPKVDELLSKARVSINQEERKE